MVHFAKCYMMPKFVAKSHPGNYLCHCDCGNACDLNSDAKFLMMMMMTTPRWLASSVFSSGCIGAEEAGKTRVEQQK